MQDESVIGDGAQLRVDRSAFSGYRFLAEVIMLAVGELALFGEFGHDSIIGPDRSDADSRTRDQYRQARTIAVLVPSEPYVVL